MRFLTQLVLVLALVAVAVDGYSFDRSNVTRQWSVRIPNLSKFEVFGANNRLIYKWLNRDELNNTVINFQSVEMGVQPCEIPVLLEYGSMMELGSAVLGNGKILIWLRDYGPRGRCWRHYLIDSQTCLYDAYRILDQYSEDIPYLIVPHRNSFDALFRDSRPLCEEYAICVMRYNDKGVNVMNLTMPNNTELEEAYRLDTVKNSDSSGYALGNGLCYLYVTTGWNGTSVVKLMNSKYEELTSHEYSHSVDAFSTTYGSISVCSFNVTEYLIVCAVLDFDLNNKSVLSIPLKNEILNLDLFNLADGGSIIITVSIYKINSSICINGTDSWCFKSVVTAYHINTSGEISEPVEIMAYDGSPIQNLINVKYFELRNGVHCITTWIDASAVTTNCITPFVKPNLKVIKDESLYI